MVEEVGWEKPEGFTLECVLPDGKGGLYLVGLTQTLHRDGSGKVRPFADAGSPAGAVAFRPGGGLLLGKGSVLLAADADGKVTEVATGFEDLFGVAVDARGRILVADWGKGTIVRIAEGEKTELATGLKHPSGLVLRPDGTLLIKESGRQENADMRVLSLGEEGGPRLFVMVPSVSRFGR